MSDKPDELPVSPRHRERNKRLLQAFSLSSLTLAGLFLLATLVCHRQSYELGENNPYGFALWFLLLCAYVPLELIGLFTWLTGNADSALLSLIVNRHQALTLGLINMLATLVVWAVVRFWAARKFGLPLLEAMYNIMLILCGWGCFQLLCLGLNLAWSKGGLSPLHEHLNRPEEPIKVNIVHEPPDLGMPTAP